MGTYRVKQNGAASPAYGSKAQAQRVAKSLQGAKVVKNKSVKKVGNMRISPAHATSEKGCAVTAIALAAGLGSIIGAAGYGAMEAARALL